MINLLTGIVLGVLLTLASVFIALVVRRRPEPKLKRGPYVVDIVEAENVTRIEKWRERRAKTDETFGRRA